MPRKAVRRVQTKFCDLAPQNADRRRRLAGATCGQDRGTMPRRATDFRPVRVQTQSPQSESVSEPWQLR